MLLIQLNALERKEKWLLIAQKAGKALKKLLTCIVDNCQMQPFNI